MITRAMITIQDFERRQFTVCVNGVKTQTDAQNLADVMQQHSMGAVVAIRWVAEILYNSAGGEGGCYDTVNQRLSVLLRDENSEKINFDIPAPRDSCFTADQEGNIDILRTIKTTLEAATGKTLTVVSHGLKSFAPDTIRIPS